MKSNLPSIPTRAGALTATTGIYSDSVRPQRSDTDALAREVLRRLSLEHPGAPFYQPKQIGPVLGITDNAFTVYCRNSPHLKLWRGSYRFFADDPDHVALLLKVIKVVLWSGQKLPAELRPSGRGVARVM